MNEPPRNQDRDWDRGQARDRDRDQDWDQNYIDLPQNMSEIKRQTFRKRKDLRGSLWPPQITIELFALGSCENGSIQRAQIS